MSEMQNNDEEIVIDFGELWKALKKEYKFITKITGICLALGIAGTLVFNPGYESLAILKVQPPRSLNKSMLETEMINEHLAAQYLTTYGQLMTSRSVIYDVIQNLKDPEDQGKDIAVLYEKYVKRIKIEPISNATLMQVTVTGKEEENTQKFAQLLMKSFFNKASSIEQGDTKNTSNFIVSQLEAAKTNMAEAEKNLQEFQAEHKMLSPDEDVKMATAKLSMANNVKAQAEVGIKTSQAELESIATKLNENIPVIADNDIIRNYRSRLADLTVKKIELEEKYTEKHPDIIQINEELAGLQEKLELEISKIAQKQSPSTNSTYQGLLAKKIVSEVELEINKRRLEAVRQIESEYANDVKKLSVNKQKYVNLSREMEIAKDIYVMLTKRLEETKVAANAESGIVQIVDNPTIFKAKRNGTIKVGLSFLLGLLGSCSFVIGKEILNPKIKKSSDIVDKTGLKVLAEIPENEESALNVYRNIRSMLMAMPDVKTILFTSCISDEGNSHVCGKLAELMAKAGLKVALVNTSGLVSIMQGNSFKVTTNNNLFISQNDVMPQDGCELLASKDIDEVIAHLKETYDFVLIEAPALDGASDAIVLGNKVDGVIQVVKSAIVHPAVFNSALNNLSQAGAKVLGAILRQNDVDSYMD